MSYTGRFLVSCTGRFILINFKFRPFLYTGRFFSANSPVSIYRAVFHQSAARPLGVQSGGNARFSKTQFIFTSHGPGRRARLGAPHQSFWQAIFQSRVVNGGCLLRPWQPPPIVFITGATIHASAVGAPISNYTPVSNCLLASMSGCVQKKCRFENNGVGGFFWVCHS